MSVSKRDPADASLQPSSLLAGVTARHIVQIYETEDYLIRVLAEFVRTGLEAGENAVVIAEPAHREALAKRLAEEAQDPAILEASGRLVLLDAAATLREFMSGGRPDRARFRRTWEGIAARCGHPGRPLRAFGEMVAVLWAEGNRDGALALEALWDELLREHSATLLCAYPTSGFRDADGLARFGHVCDSHALVLPSESYSAPELTERERLRVVADLQAKALVLEAQTRILAKQLGDLKDLHETARNLGAAANPEESLAGILRMALSAYGTDKGVLSLCAPDGKGLRLAVQEGFSADLAARLAYVPCGSGAWGRCQAIAAPVLVSDTEEDPVFADWRETARAGGFRAVHCLPLLDRQGLLLGVLSMHFPRPHRPTAQEAEYGEVYARLAADTLEQAELLRRSREEAEHRRQREAAAHWLAAIVRSSSDAIVSKDLNSIVTSWNKGAERIFGYTAEEMVGKSITLLIPENHIDEEPQILDRIRRGETLNHYDTIRRRKDGRLINISLTVSPIVDGEGRIIGASKIARDVTSLKNTEEQLRQTQKMEAVGRLAGGIAHDFNNLLTSILGFTDMALAEAGPGTPLAEYLDEVRKSGERAASLTQQLLAYSRKQILAPRVLDLNAVVSDMDRMLRRLIGEDVGLRTTLDPGLGRVKADPTQIQQMVVNLVLNARDAMPEGGEIRLETANVLIDSRGLPTHLEARPGLYAMISVTDTGIGMTPEVKARLFEPFFTTKEVGKGTGLGLSSVYGMVQQAGGAISVESEPGRGAAFRIYLPLVEEVDPATGEPLRPKTARRAEGAVVLLAEDEATVRKFLGTILRAEGYQVLEASDGAEALETGRAIPRIDLLLTDIVMPRMNGARLTEALRERHPGLKVLFMSGYAKDALDERSFAGGEAGFLQKPFRQADVLARVRDALKPAPPA